MSSPTQLDITVRMQLAGEAYSELVNEYANDLKWGRKCNKFEDIFFLNAYIELLECYDVDSENNCITEDQLTQVFNNIQKLTHLTFKPYGFSYQS